MKTKYKVLKSDLKSPFEGFQYEIGKEYFCENFDDNELIDCSRGFYATDLEGLTYSYEPDRKVFECEVSGKEVLFNIYKQRFEKIILIKEIPTPKIKKMVSAYDKTGTHGYFLEKALFPFNPLSKNRMRIPRKEKELLKELASVRASVWDSVGASVRDSVRASVWDSVGASVRDSVWDSVGDSVRASVWDSVGASVWASVGASVRDSVWDSVGASVWASVRDSVWAYISSIFPNVKKWEYVDHTEGINPFQPCIELWNAGLVPSFDGKIWRLHTGNDAKIIFEWEK